MSTDNTLREYTLSLNEFNQPKIYTNNDATCLKLMQLILLEKGTYPTRPDMGVGIVSRYRFSLMDNLTDLKSDIQDQVLTYLPELLATDITVEGANKEIHIYITIDETVYSLTFSQETTTLSSL